MSTGASTTEVFYPSGDGEPMAETGIHVQAIVMLHQALQDFFADRTDVFIASDMFWYYQEGNPEGRIAPDVMVVPGVGNHQRRSFFSWEEPAIPAVVFEMASAKTWKLNLNRKYQRYEKLGVKEYFVFDPEDLYLEQPLLGFRLHGGSYRPVRRKGLFYRSQLGFSLKVEGTMLRVIDTATSQPILTRAEAVNASESKAYRAMVAEQDAQAVAQGAQAAAREAQAAVRDALDAAREAQAAAREAQAAADAVAVVAAEAAREAAAERKRANALAAEVERLKKLLDKEKA